MVIGKHNPLISQDLWDQTQAARARNRNSTHTSTPSKKRMYSLTGITWCWYCRGRIHSENRYKRQPRFGCYSRRKGWDCPQKSAGLSVYEDQILDYLSTLHIPQDYQTRILEMQRRLEPIMKT